MIYVTPRTYHQTVNRFVATANPSTLEDVDILEIVGTNFVLKNAADHLVMDPAFSFDLPGAVSELYNFLSGGSEIGSHGIPWDVRLRAQLREACELFSGTKGPAHFVMNFTVPGDEFATPIQMMQLISRDGRLDAISTITNEELIGSFPSSIYLLTVIQEYVARRGSLILGGHYFDVGSSFIFKSDMHIVKAAGSSPRWPFLMEAMPLITFQDINNWKEEIEASFAKPHLLMSNMFKPYAHTDEAWEWLNSQAGVILSFALKEANPIVAAQAYTLINDPSLKRPLRPILAKAGVKEIRRRTSKA